ncbi:MAG: choice-of-anchor D domain-containing protein, partial [Bacteroidetes bacterium]|nr:choice-of-anchor D domain-containing protein [Bacteroidota bacterium]
SILGAGMFLMVDQAHYALPGELVEGGQLLSLYNPDTYNANPEVNILGNNLNILNNDVTPSTTDNTDFGTIMKDNTLNKTFVIQNNGVGSLIIKGISITGLNSTEFKLINPPTFPLTINSNNVYSYEVQFAPTVMGARNAKVSIITNDVDENTYTYNVTGNASQNTKLNAAMKLASSIQLYPNPANNETNIVLNLISKENVTIKMFDIQGKEIYTTSQLLEQGNNTLKLNTGDLKSGIYFIEVIINNNLSRIKVAVSH